MNVDLVNLCWFNFSTNFIKIDSGPAVNGCFCVLPLDRPLFLQQELDCHI